MKTAVKLNLVCIFFTILSTGIFVMYYQSFMSYDNNWFQYNQVQPSSKSPDVAPALSNHVIMFVIDGGRYMQLLDPTLAPNISNFAKEGTLVINNHCILPSISLPNYAAIGTGAPPLLTEVVYNDPQKAEQSFPVESLFDVINQTNRAGYQINSSIVAFDWWHSLYPNATQWIQEGDGLNTTALGDGLRSLITSHTLGNFTLIHFLATDENGHKYGGMSSEYNQSVSDVDKQIGLAYQALIDNGYSNYTIIITADHGHTIEGGHGGQNPDVLHIPLIYYGPNIKAGQQIKFPTSQLDNTPTISYILGIRVPKDARGNILYDLFTKNSTTAMQHREAQYNLMMLNLSIQQLYAAKTGLKWSDSALNSYVSGDPNMLYSQFQAEFNNGTNSSLISSETQNLRIKVDQFFANSEAKINSNQAMWQGLIFGIIIVGIIVGSFFLVKNIRKRKEEKQEITRFMVSRWIIGGLSFFGILTIAYLIYSTMHVISLGAIINGISYHYQIILSFWIIVTLVEIFSIAFVQYLLYNRAKKHHEPQLVEKSNNKEIHPDNFNSAEQLAGSFLMTGFITLLLFVLLLEFTVPIYPEYAILNSRIILTILLIFGPLLLFNISLIFWSIITKISRSIKKFSKRKTLTINAK